LEEQYLTTEEVATMLRVSVQSVNKWCREGKLKAIRAGRRWRITRADLNQFTQQGVPHEQSPKASGLVAFAQ
jgi:excisionase family DNA binding protein